MADNDYFCSYVPAEPLTSGGTDLTDMDNRTLTDIISSRLQIEPDEVKRLSAALGEVIGESMARLDPVAVSSFGVFEPKQRDERIALHPATGRRLLVPPRIVVGFRPSASLKQAVDRDDMQTDIMQDNEDTEGPGHE